jgi:hypothetical protein
MAGGTVLNIGKLSAGATEYYVGEVATTAENYCSGRGACHSDFSGNR